jgi:hypothetical protein
VGYHPHRWPFSDLSGIPKQRELFDGNRDLRPDLLEPLTH